jgi:hypothetical protein
MNLIQQYNNLMRKLNKKNYKNLNMNYKNKIFKNKLIIMKINYNLNIRLSHHYKIHIINSKQITIIFNKKYKDFNNKEKNLI